VFGQKFTLPSLVGERAEAVAALAIDKIGPRPRPYHFRSGPTLGPTTLGPRKAKQDVKLSLEYPTVLPLSRLSVN